MLCRYRAVMTVFFFMWNENIDGMGEKLLPTKAVCIASLNLSTIHWSLSKNKTQEQNRMFRIESCAKLCLQPNRSQTKCDLPQERTSAQIRIDQHSDCRWRREKACKRCLAWFWIESNQSLQPNRSQMKCDVWTRCKWPALTERASIFEISIWRFWAICLCRQSSTALLTNSP